MVVSRSSRRNEHMDAAETVWDLRRGERFKPPPGWSVVTSLPEGEGVSHLDGLTYFWYGNWFSPDNPEGWRVVTMPNASWIPYPHLQYRDVHLRQDGFLGREDPVTSPQLHNGALPHLACISLSGPEGSDALFFREKIDFEFVDPPTSFPRRCEPSPIAKSRCRKVWDRLKLEYMAFVARHGKDRHKRLNVVTSLFEIGVGSISQFQGMYLELTFHFAILCRLYLEIEAYYRHHELSESHKFSMDPRPVDTSLVGTITMDETVCYRFHHMGVLVWLNRRLAPSPGVPCRLITERIPLNRDFQKVSTNGIDVIITRIPHVRPIFEGHCNDTSYLLRISDWVQDCFRTELGIDHPLRSFFASYQRKPHLQSENEAETSKKRKTDGSGGGKASKKAKRRKNRPADGVRADPSEAEPSMMAGKQQEGPKPPHIASFALADLTIDLKQLLQYATPKPSGAWETVDRELEPESKPSLHLVPALDVFTGVDNVLQLKCFIYVWLKVKNRWLLRVSKELQPPEFANRRAWRTFMRGSFDPSPIRPESEAGKSRLHFTDYLGLSEPLTFDINSTKLGLAPLHPLKKTVEGSSVRNALHEINEINFLYDVYEVELRRTWDLPSIIVDRLRHIAGNNRNPFENPTPISRRSISERLGWIVALKDVVKEWLTSFPKPRDFDLEPRRTPAGPKVEDVLALELAVAKYYAHVAREILGRRPTIPLYR
ncbi:hypothetical protein BDM02DRAFT_3133072 [Thelephora ganbajun]|uniref:Uncharacterized protein n=1 Tax=Thelephora ganbajun TaxID=370292 RepID=A0ACB6YZ25_THEGA|nr:hypothetical protein BDM02DRAFT_3133072 [Thelephora ganbajun]